MKLVRHWESEQKMSLSIPEKSPSEFVIRTLEPRDLKEYVKLLGQLTSVEKHTQHELEERLQLISKNPFHQIFVLIQIKPQLEYSLSTPPSLKLVGCATLLIEPKFIRGMTHLGHIEDVCVNDEFRGLGYGQVLIEHLKRVAQQSGCYKVSLNCSDKNVTFYQKCGFFRNANQMTETFVRSRL